MKSIILWLQREWFAIQLNGLYKKKKHVELIRRCLEVKEAGLDFYELYSFLTWSYMDTEQLDQARLVAGEALGKYPDHPVFLSLHGEVSYRLGDYESANESLKKALSLSEGNLQVEYLLGLNHIAMGELDKAADYFESILRYDPALLQTRLLVMAESYIFKASKSKIPL